MKKRPAKQHFVQSTGQWRKDIFVCSGYSAKEIIDAVHKIKGAHKWALDWVKGREKDWQEMVDKNNAFAALEVGHGLMVLRLRPYFDAWEFWEVLIHETSHLVDFMSELQGIGTETEAKAYLQEYMFHEIRRKLMGLDKY